MRVLIAFLLILSTYLGSAQQNFRRCAPQNANCCDRNKFCVFWSQNNECTINPTWMRRNCQLSCQACPSSSSQLSSDSPHTSTSPSRSSNAPAGCNSVVPIEVETRQVFGIMPLRTRFKNIGCGEVQIPPDCSVNSCFHRKYRSIDGTCNNGKNTIMGASFTSFSRMLPAAYDDGVSTLVSTLTRSRPNAREVSVFLLSSSRAVSSHASSMLMQFAQYVSHDLTKTSNMGGCNCQSGGRNCISVPRPSSDRRTHKSSCVPMTRSLPVCGTGLRGRPRDQFNENTAFIDGSTIYGSEAVTLRSLRAGAMLRTSVVNNRVFPVMPTSGGMMGGDDRVNLFVGLAALHTSFLRLHNNVAARLQNMNSHWNQDRVFQESRKIIGAVTQSIVYNEFLPSLIGPFHDRLVPAYTGYNERVNPSVINEFTSAAYRLHGMIQERYPLLNSNFQQTGSLPFNNGVNRVTQVLANIDGIYRGFIATPSRNPQRLTSSLTETFMNAGDMDMATVNIQRGRDHGLRPYNDYRKLCNLSPVTSFDEWPEVTDSTVRQRVSQLYNSPDDLDLYVGGILEEPIEGSMVGPTFACILAEQFVRLRDGDRFYYENPEIFTTEQMATLKETTLSWVLCDTGDSMTRITPRAFSIDNGHDAVSCSTIRGLDLSAWRE